MGRLPDMQRTKLILVTLLLCIGSLVVCEVIDPLLANEGIWDISFTEEYFQHTHLDEHDDDFVLISQIGGNITAITVNKDKSSDLLGASYSLAPLLPPPKAA
jgi:hypothetical protein